MSESVYRHNDNGHILSLGAHPRRQYDPREQAYALARVIDITGVDLTKEYSLLYAGSDGALWDPRPAITDQGQKGACAAFAACELAEICSWQSGNGQPVLLSGSDLYERVRKLEEGASWQQDNGSTLADNLDLAIKGLYSAADAPESDNLTENYDALTAGKTTYTYVGSHLPFYPQDASDPDYFVKAIAASIAVGMPVDLGLDWYQPWFTPDAHGVLPMANLGQAVGGHSIYAYRVSPAFGGVVVCANHWTATWNPQGAQLGNHGRPGDFGIPFSFFRGNTHAFIEGRAVHWATVAPPPPANGCQTQAFALADTVIAQYQTQLQAHPRSTTARASLTAAQTVRAALGGLPS